MSDDKVIAGSLRAAGLEPALDASCKRTLSLKVFLAWIMRSCVEEYRDCSINEIMEKYIESQPEIGSVPVAPDETNARIRGTANEDATVTEGTVNYDIRFLASAPEGDAPIGLIINVEAQNKFHPGYSLVRRGIYYCSRMISAQYGTEFANAHYERIRKVYSIWICVNPPQARRNTITCYKMTEQNMVGNVRESPADYDLLTTVMVCLGSQDGADCGGILRLLSVLLSSTLEYKEKLEIFKTEFDIKITDEIDREVSEMCNISKGVMEQGIEKGVELGIEKGIEKGIEQGKEKGMLESIRNLMDSLKLTAEQAMDALKVPEADRPKFLELLKQ